MFRYLLFLWLGLMPFLAVAQTAFTADEAIDYALKHNPSIKSSALGISDAQLQIKEIKAAGLPQISGQFQYTYNAIVPSQLLKAKNFDPEAVEGELVKFQFGIPWGGQMSIGFNQLIYDASWVVGLKAAKTYMEFANQNQEQSIISLAVVVKKAYYSVLVAEERAKVLDLNASRLDSLYREISILNAQGFAEKLDLDRLKVQQYNLETERQKVKNLIELTYQLLKFQMGYDLNQELTLKDKLDDVSIEEFKLLIAQTLKPENRIEFKILQTQRKLLEFSVDRYKKAAYPTLFFSGNIGLGHSNVRFNPFERWFPSSAISIGANIPIYSSGLQRIKIDRERLNLKKLEYGEEMMLQGFQLENDQAIIGIKNGLQALETQKRNLDLANEIVRVTKIKYSSGIGSNLELVNSESELKQAQTNYFAALYDVIISKIDFDKAQGKLLPSNIK